MRKTSLLALLLALIFVLTSCAQAGPTATNSAATDNPQQATSAPAASASSGSDTGAADKGVLQLPLAQPATLTAFVLQAQAVADMTNNYVTDLVKKNTNITIDFKWNVTGDDGKTKLNLLMAGNDLPDIFLRTGWTKAEALLYGSQGLILPLQNYLKEMPLWNQYNQERASRLPGLTLPDGNIYSYGDGGGTGENHVNYQARMYVWKPWVDSLMGGKMPTTTDEFYDYLNKVKTMDPNQDGKQDEIPLSGSIANGQWATDPTTFLLNSFIQTNCFITNTNSGFQPFMINDSKKVEFQFAKDEYKQGIAYLNKLFKEGLLDSQTFTMDGTQLTAIGSNKPHILGACAGGWFGSFCDTASFSKGIVDDTWDGWALLSPLKGPNGAQYSFYTLPESGLGNGFVSKTCSNPNLAVNLFEYLTTPELTLAQSYGPKDTAWAFTNEGKAVDGGTATWKLIQATKFKDDGTADWGLPFATIAWPSDVQISSLGDFKSHQLVEKPETDLEYLLYQAQTEYGKYRPKTESMMPNIAFNEEDSKKESEFMVSIGGYCSQARVQFITGDLSVDKDWDTYIKTLNDMGLNDYIALNQKVYDESAAAPK